MKRSELGPFLEAIHAHFARKSLISTDPIQLPHRYQRSEDQEVVAFIAAGLSFGSVATILRAAEAALRPLGEHPASALVEMNARQRKRGAEGFNHRWVFSEDLENLYQMLGMALAEHGGLEPLFASGMTPSASDVRPGLKALNQGLGSYLSDAQRARRGTRYFLSAAMGPGAAKRLHMFMRWMVRDEDVDLGLWRSASPAQLIVPLDTHVGRIGRRIGLTKLKSPGLKMALEITQSLRRVDADDPVRFDFALSRLGILCECVGRRGRGTCGTCRLFPYQGV